MPFKLQTPWAETDPVVFEYPSQVIRSSLKGPNGNRMVWIPEKEAFRIRNIFEEHEYGIPPQYLPSGPLTVVDIGANVGLFALYMRKVRAEGDIFCFEPAPPALDLLRKNVGEDPEVHVYAFALSNREGKAQLHLNPSNSGENSLKPAVDGLADTVRVEVKDAGTVFLQMGLTYIDILKIDTEGCEVEILESLQRFLPYVGIIMMEYHCEADRRKIDALLGTHILFNANVCRPHLGIVKYINTRLI